MARLIPRSVMRHCAMKRILVTYLLFLTVSIYIVYFRFHNNGSYALNNMHVHSRDEQDIGSNMAELGLTLGHNVIRQHGIHKGLLSSDPVEDVKIRQKKRKSEIFQPDIKRDPKDKTKVNTVFDNESYRKTFLKDQHEAKYLYHENKKENAEIYEQKRIKESFKNESKINISSKLIDLVGEDRIMDNLTKTRSEDLSEKFVGLEYPLKVDIQKLYKQYMAEGRVDVAEINQEYPIYLNPKHKCTLRDDQERIKIVFVVKTSPQHFEIRTAIRTTWGNENRFGDIRVVFSMGNPNDKGMVHRIQKEWDFHKDILFVNYMDTYHNLTLKTIAGINWASSYCKLSEYVISVDDDFYVATDLLIKTLEDMPYTESQRLFSGHINRDTFPLRNYKGSYSKWNVDKEEYPWGKYPLYVSGGFVVMSRQVVTEFNFAIKYTKVFKFEDVYLGILANRMGIEVSEILDSRVDSYMTYAVTEDFKTLLASHGYSSTPGLKEAWECHVGIMEQNKDKLVYCRFIDQYLASIKKNIENIILWVDIARQTLK